jgi:hypothetical protein
VGARGYATHTREGNRKGGVPGGCSSQAKGETKNWRRAAPLAQSPPFSVSTEDWESMDSPSSRRRQEITATRERQRRATIRAQNQGCERKNSTSLLETMQSTPGTIRHSYKGPFNYYRLMATYLFASFI